VKKAIVLSFALLLTACQEEEQTPMTFGLDLRVLHDNLPPDQVGSLCAPPGAYDGETTGVGKWGDRQAPPYLFLDADPDTEENVYRVRVFIASEHDEDGIWWKPSEVLAERSYDSTFGESGGEDSFVVDFEGKPYTIEVLGLPASCPTR
jgi:hypothetical protein